MNEIDELRMNSRAIPQAVEVELKVLGAIILDPKAFDNVDLQPDHFYDKKNRLVFEAMQRIAEEGVPIDNVSVYEMLKKMGKLEEAGGPAFIGQLSQDITSAAHVEYHCKVIIEKWAARKIISNSMEIAELAYSGSEDIWEVASNGAEVLYNIDNGLKATTRSTTEIIKSTHNIIELSGKGETDKLYLPSGIHSFDKHFLGFPVADVSVIAARPGMGKTSLALQLLKNATNLGYNPGIFELEMTGERLMISLIADEANINSIELQKGNYQGRRKEYNRALIELQKIENINDQAGMSVDDMRIIARSWVREKNCRLILVDYLQIIRVTKQYNTTNDALTAIMNGLKRLAKDLGVALVAFSQLNRSVEQTSDKRPMLSHLRESGSIEQVAASVLFIYRPDYYNIKASMQDGFQQFYTLSGEPLTDREYTELICAKNRFGMVGTFPVRFIPEYQRFEGTQGNNISYPEAERYTQAPPVPYAEDKMPYPDNSKYEDDLL